MSAARTILIVCGTLAMLVAAETAVAQGSVARARELYASAAYEEALTMLDGVVTGSGDEERAAALYRVLCLVALEREAEADTAIESLVQEHPSYRPPADELPPRVRAALSDARRRLLPGIVQTRYAAAKDAFDADRYGEAVAGFKWVVEAFADPDLAQAARESAVADLQTLAAGFQELSEKALAPPPAPQPVPQPPPAPARDYRRLYAASDPDVVPPVTIRQDVPPFPGRPPAAAAGVLEVIIDRGGVVESARMVVGVHPRYDDLVVSAAKKWRYEPARVDGIPVSFVKQIEVAIAPSPPR